MLFHLVHFLFLGIISLSCAAFTSASATHRSSQPHKMLRRASQRDLSTDVAAPPVLVCTPDACLTLGTANFSVGSSIIVPLTNGSSTRLLLPGSYMLNQDNVSNNSATQALAYPISQLTVTNMPGFTSLGQLTTSLVVSGNPGIVTFPSLQYSGQGDNLTVENVQGLYDLTTHVVQTISGSQWESLLVFGNYRVILQLQGSNAKQVTVWDSVPDITQILNGVNSFSILDLQSTTCEEQCASGGYCASSGQCVCRAGYVGSTCSQCAEGFFGPSCSPCPIDCKLCAAGITGSGACLDPPAQLQTSSSCGCFNGVCAGNTTTSTCYCNAGWINASNGTQCATCSPGYYLSSFGDCLSCDPSCATCADLTGNCVACQAPLQPDSTNAFKCKAAAFINDTTNGTFSTCQNGSYFDNLALSCITCNPLCSTCWNGGETGCLECRTPNVILNNRCVAMDSVSGLCDSSDLRTGANATINLSQTAVWLFDKEKGICDAIPVGCSSANVDNTVSSLQSSNVKCTACLAGLYLFQGRCMASCPSGFVAGPSSSVCVACSSSCATCLNSPTECLACPDTSQVILNGTCITGPLCPTGFFRLSNTVTCLPCHPDCTDCDSSAEYCTTCSGTRPVLTPSHTCVQTCESNEYFDTASSSCKLCSSGCATCSGSDSTACLSCPPSFKLNSGSCKKSTCDVLPDLNLCLSDLGTTITRSTSSPVQTLRLSWWCILLITVGGVILKGIVFVWWRFRERKKRLLRTTSFANKLDKKEVDVRLQKLRKAAKHVIVNLGTTSHTDSPTTPTYKIDQAMTHEGVKMACIHRPLDSTSARNSASSVYSTADHIDWEQNESVAWQSRNPFRPVIPRASI